MSIYSAFYSSLSGLGANANAMSVIGNDLANLNTVGYKGGSANFQDLFSASLGATSVQGNGNPIQIGLGSSLSGISQNFGQGSFKSTGNSMDMAIQGQGFFTMQTPTGVAGFTRAGNFNIHKSGSLVDSNGNSVMGWNRSGNKLSTNGLPSPIQINMGISSPPSATQNVSMVTNLNSSAATGTVYSTPVEIYDSLGAAHSLLFTYTKQATPGTWALGVTTDGGATVTGAPASLTFNAAGVLTGAAGGGTPANPTLNITGWPNGATSPPMTWNLASNGNATITGYASESTTSSSAQDGYAAGSVSSTSVDQNGFIIGTFTNGQTLNLAQVAISNFANTGGLAKMGGNMWGASLASGSPATGVANTGGRGTVLGANLELSNVDVADEFTRMIVNQRAYQASSRVVTTTDSLLQEALSLVR
jgi:flagellar hook protein FlgE